ncbi:MAG: PfkB family carbohydrate kinase, partial [Spirochaetota bacterium]
MSYTIVSFGEALWDLLPDGPVLGGAPLNLAYRINTLGHKGIILSRLGNDDLGKRALEALKNLRMDTGFIQIDAGHNTGTVHVHLDELKNPHFEIVGNAAYDFIEPSAAMTDVVKNADCLCFGTLVQRTEVSRKTLYGLLEAYRGRYVLYDINLRKDCFSKPV